MEADPALVARLGAEPALYASPGKLEVGNAWVRGELRLSRGGILFAALDAGEAPAVAAALASLVRVVAGERTRWFPRKSRPTVEVVTARGRAAFDARDGARQRPYNSELVSPDTSAYRSQRP